MQIEAYPMDMKMMLGLPPAERMGEHRLHRLKQLPLMDRKPLANPEQIVGWQRQIDAEIYDNPSSKGPHVMLVCDSFGCELREHLAPLCRRLVIAPSSVLPHAIIEREKPDLVIVEMAERRLGRFP